MLKLLIAGLTSVFVVVLFGVITLHEFLHFMTAAIIIVSIISVVVTFVGAIDPFKDNANKYVGYMIVSLLIFGIFVCLKIKYF